MTCGCGCPTACGILVPWPGNPCPPHWMVDSQPLDHQEVPSSACFLMVLSRSRVSTVNREPASVGPVCFSLSPNLLAVWSPPEKDTALSGKRGRREPNGQGQSTVHLAGTRQRCGRVCTSLPQAPRPPSRLPELKLPNIFCAFPSVSVFFSPSCSPTTEVREGRVYRELCGPTSTVVPAAGGGPALGSGVRRGRGPDRHCLP